MTLSRRSLTRRLAMLAAVSALGVATAIHAKGVALIVGVSDYGSRNLNLHGPVNDAEALRDVLIRRWGFAASDVRLLTDARATKAGIVAELRALRERSSAGDDVVIYLSGHGTSALDGTARLAVPHGSGAFIPYDFDPSTPERTAGTLLVGRIDLRPLLEALDQGVRGVSVINDACYPGNALRSVALPAAHGMDLQLAFAFDTRPEGIDELLGMLNVDAGDGRLSVLEQMLARHDGRFTFGHSTLRASAALKP